MLMDGHFVAFVFDSVLSKKIKYINGFYQKDVQQWEIYLKYLKIIMAALGSPEKSEYEVQTLNIAYQEDQFSCGYYVALGVCKCLNKISSTLFIPSIEAHQLCWETINARTHNKIAEEPS